MVFSILLIVIVVNLVILMNNTYSKLSDKINDIFTENLSDLGRETSATLNVFVNISRRAIEKNNLIMSDILNEKSMMNYPLDWT